MAFAEYVWDCYRFKTWASQSSVQSDVSLRRWLLSDLHSNLGINKLCRNLRTQELLLAKCSLLLRLEGKLRKEPP